MDLNRLVKWVGYIDRRSYARVMSRIESLLLKSAKEPITLWLFSGGGEMDVGLAFYDAVQLLKPTLIIVGTGEVSSTAPIILAAGKTRILTKNTTLFFHNVGIDDLSRGTKLSTNLMRTVAWEIDHAIERYQNILVERSGKLLSQRKIKELMDNERSITAEEAVKLGLADMVANPEHFRVDG